MSTAGQSLNEQKETLKNSRAEMIFSEKYSGTATSRPQFEKLVHLIEPNDTLIVTKLDRFARNTREALNLIDDLLKEKIMIKVIKRAGQKEKKIAVTKLFLNILKRIL